MLRRKYYAQKGNSKGEMNTSPVAGSNYTMLKNRKNTFSFINMYKPMNNRRTSQIHTEIQKFNTIRCNTSDNTTTRDSTCSNRPNGDTSVTLNKKVCYVHKDVGVDDYKTYIEKQKTNRSCIQNDPVPVINTC